jgi:galactose-1-phosphate uridylyltransferase
MPPTIADLPDVAAGLAAPARARFDRLFAVAQSDARIVPPPRMEDWIVNQFKYLSGRPPGTPEWRAEVLARVGRQRIVHVLNRVTGQATLFNAVRSARPMEARSSDDLEREIEAARAKCSFCRPMDLTPANAFGRIGQKTCANVAAYDGWHGLVIFQEHSPLEFRRDEFTVDKVVDLLRTARAWAEKVRAADGEARFFFLMWNCLWKAGASILHGHAQMTVGRGFHYGKVERLRRDAARYADQEGRDYFDDLVAVHEDLGLAARWEGDVTALAHLVPVKEKEIVLVCESLESPDTAAAIHRALRLYGRPPLDVKSYNLAVYLPPLGDPDPEWATFPVLVHLVDRGDLAAKTADVGAMELYASSVVSSDPFGVAEALRGNAECGTRNAE